MNLYRRFREGLVMNYYNELTKDKNEVLFSPSYSMSGVRGAVRIMVFSLIVSVISLPIGASIFFIWLFLCSYIYKGSVESQMGNGYPYLEAGDMIGLMIGYLIMIPIALGVYFLFLGGYEYLADLADLSQREGFFARLLVLFVAWISYMFLFRNNTWDDRNKEWIKEFEAQDQEIEKKEDEDREKNGTYENFIKNLDEKFTPPKDIKSTEKIKDPVISKKKLDNFIQWVHSISKDNKRLDLASLLNKNKKLEVIVPGLSISICKIEKQPRTPYIECLDGQDLDTYKIYYNCKYNCWEFSDNRKWVTIINNPNVTDEVCDDIYENWDWYINGVDSYEEKLYLEEGDFYLPYNLYSEHYDCDSDYLYQSVLYCTQEVDFWKKSVVINGGKFKFKENEKEYLILVLMASYKPSLLKRILKELEK
jgi:hypothetical protein